MSEAALLKDLINAYRDDHATKFAVFSAATIIFYDYVISFAQEVEFVWKREWSIIKIIFIWHRYLGILAAIVEVAATTNTKLSPELFLMSVISCNFWIKWETWGYAAVVISTEVVLLLWIWVIYNKNRGVLLFMILLLIGEIGAVIAILTRAFYHLNAQPFTLFPGVQVCGVTNPPAFFKSVWTPVLAYNVVVLGLYLFRGYHVYTRNNGYRLSSSSAFTDLYNYSLINFLGIVASYLVCVVVWLAQSSDLNLAQLPVGFVLSFSIINSTRLLLNIRHAYYTHIDRVDMRIMIQHPEEVMSDFDTDSIDQRRLSRRGAIYASDTSRDVWVSELRDLRFGGFK